jgi:hypothetical protein
MSMRPSVDKAAIESFLQHLGQTFRKPARLYLVGGAALIHLGSTAWIYARHTYTGRWSE